MIFMAEGSAESEMYLNSGPKERNIQCCVLSEAFSIFVLCKTVMVC